MISDAGLSGRRALARLLATLLMTALVLAQATTGGLAAPATSHVEVIAQGVAPMPTESVTWRVVRRQARPANEATSASTRLGFTLADADSFVVTDEATRAQVILDPGEAAFHRDGAKETRQSFDERPAAYFDIELVAATDARKQSTLNGGRLLFAGDSFTMPQGTRQLELSRDVLRGGETGSFVGSRTPMLIFVTAGDLSVTDRSGKAHEIAAGKAALVSGNLTLQGGQSDGASYVVARVGRSLPEAKQASTPTRTSTPEPARTPVPTAAPTQAPTEAPSAPTGTFRITIFSCPQGVDPTQSPEGCQPGQSADGGYIQINQGEIVASGQKFMISDGARDGDAYVLEDVPAATYAIKGFTKPGADAVLYMAPPAEAGQDAWMVTIGAGQTVSVNAYWFDPNTLGSSNTSSNGTANGGTGQLALWFYACPAGTDPTSNQSLGACQSTDDPYGFFVTDTQGNGDTYATSDASRNNGGYIFDIPASVYQVSAQNVPATVEVYVMGNDVAGGGRTIAIHVVAGATSNVSIYLVPAGSADDSLQG
jgi:hypothetical protein